MKKIAQRLYNTFTNSTGQFSWAKETFIDNPSAAGEVMSKISC